MNITLKQSDIEKAVRLYIERQGFHLLNKTLAIDFSMGRGENGLSAILTIEDAVSIPGYTDAEDAPKVTSAGPSAAVKAMAAGVTTQASVASMPALPKAAAAVEAKPAVVEAVATPAAAIVDDVVAEVEVEQPKTAPATLKEAAEALLIPSDSPAVAAVLQAAPVAAIAEAKTAEAAPAPVAEAKAAEAKPTTSLFG